MTNSVTPLVTTAPHQTTAKEIKMAETFIKFSADLKNLLDASDPESTDGGIF